jgi:hypothetical protein
MRIQVIIVLLGISVPVFFYFEHERSDREIAQIRNALNSLKQRQAQDAETQRVRPRRPFNPIEERAELAKELVPPPSEGSPVPGLDPLRADSAGSRDTQPPPSPIEEVAPFLETLETTYEQDEIDASWSRMATEKLQYALYSRMPNGAQLESIECRSTLCRVESTFDSRSQMEEFVQSALRDPERRPWNGAMTTGPIQEDPVSGRTTMLTFLTREGEEFPNTPAVEPGASL